MKSSKHRLELNNKQRTLAFKHAGTARHAYNWGVELCNETEELPSAIDLHKLLVKDVKPENMWYYEVSKCAPQKALINLHLAWKRYFMDLKNGVVAKKKATYIKERKAKGLPVKNSKLYNMCKPQFKKKGMRDSFYLEGSGIVINGNRIKIPIFGWVKMSEGYEEGFTVKNVVVSRHADHFFISFKRDILPEKVVGIADMPTVGVDLGIKTLATPSNGDPTVNPKAYRRFKRKLKIAQRVVSKRYDENKKASEQSKNYYKAQRKVAKLHYHVSCIRKDTIHKLTTELAKNHSLIGIEDLNISGMVKNHNLAGAIMDGGFYEFRRQLEYKAKWYGSILVVIDRYFASSKTCSCCGNVKDDLKLSDRTYECEECGLVIDRDLNAAINIEVEAVRIYNDGVVGDGGNKEKKVKKVVPRSNNGINNQSAVSSTASACGESYKSSSTGDSTKQEANSKALSFV